MFGFSFNKNREKYIDYSKKPKTVEFIEFIESQLTPDQLKKLELSGLGKTFSFKDRMMVFYGSMYPMFSIEDSKKNIREIIDEYSPLFDKGIEFKMNELFIKKFRFLFSFENISPQKAFLIN